MVESEIFNLIDTVDESLRAREENDRGSLRQREFFAIDKEKAYSVLESVAKLRKDLHKLKLIKPSKAEAEEEVIAEKVEEAIAHKKGDRFCFAKKGIPIGASITFIGNSTITAQVCSDNPPRLIISGKLKARRKRLRSAGKGRNMRQIST